MAEFSIEEDLEKRAELFKALGHPMRLLILNLMQIRPRHGEELAMILNVKPATISHHLTKLVCAGLLTSKKDQYYQIYTLLEDGLAKNLHEIVFLPQPGIRSAMEEDAFRKRVLESFFRKGQLLQIPRQLKKRRIILERLAQEFEPDRDYSEREVNQLLVEYHEDVASLRRGMIEHGILQRHRGIYRRAESTP